MLSPLYSVQPGPRCSENGAGSGSADIGVHVHDEVGHDAKLLACGGPPLAGAVRVFLDELEDAVGA